MHAQVPRSLYLVQVPFLAFAKHLKNLLTEHLGENQMLSLVLLFVSRQNAIAYGHSFK